MLPFFVQSDGRVREARFKVRREGGAHGGVHDLFTVIGVVMRQGAKYPSRD